MYMYHLYPLLLQAPLSDSMLTMLLCQWAVSTHRAGHHRPMVAAKILAQRQVDLLKVRWQFLAADVPDQQMPL